VDKRQVVYMGNNFIEASYKCNPVEKKILNLAVLKANKREFPDKPNPHKAYPVTMTRKDLIDIVGLDTDKDFRHITKACKSLNEKVLVYVDEKEKEILTSSFITETKLNSGELKLYFYGRVIPFFNKLKERFTSYDLLQIKHFTGKYTIRFYELCKQYENIGKRTITIGKLRTMFQLQNKYVGDNGTALFRKNVIDSAQKELKEKSELYFEYKQNKEGRKIVSITLDIKLNIRQREKNYITKRLKEYFNDHILKDFSEDLYSYFQEKKNTLSTEDTKYITGLILGAKKETLNIKMISETLLFNFFNWLEPDLGL
jgi:plasmid replication initiation protein